MRGISDTEAGWQQAVADNPNDQATAILARNNGQLLPTLYDGLVQVTPDIATAWIATAGRSGGATSLGMSRPRPQSTAAASFVPGEYLAGMGSYKDVGGHHPLSGRAFGYQFYDEAMAIGRETIGLMHPQPLTSLQQQGYMAFGQTGQPLTLTRMAQIEVDAMVKAGVSRVYAEEAVSAAIWERLANEQFTPTYIPWVGPNPGVKP